MCAQWFSVFNFPGMNCSCSAVTSRLPTPWHRLWPFGVEGLRLQIKISGFGNRRGRAAAGGRVLSKARVEDTSRWACVLLVWLAEHTFDG